MGEPNVERAGARAGMAMLRTAARDRMKTQQRVKGPHAERAGARAGMTMLRTAAHAETHGCVWKDPT